MLFPRTPGRHRPGLLFSPGCRCCGSLTATCCGCGDERPFRWEFTLAGIGGGNDVGNGCDCGSALNGPWSLFEYTACLWIQTINIETCDSGAYPEMRLVCNESQFWQSTFDSNYFYLYLNDYNPPRIVYRKLKSAWNCDADNTLDLVTGTQCTGWPATLTLTPAA
jgi:hypothetical protein